MKFTLSWLKDHLETGASLAEISAKLTAIGLEVESIHDPASALKDFIVAEIQEAAPHPNAAKLQVCKVNDGSEVRQIVCGAANARAGLKVVLAREGVFIPGSGITIKKTKIRDVESNGMLCSLEELALTGDSEGIIELPASAVAGSAAASALGVNDPVIEIAITPNRADCLGVRGIARDLAAAGVGSLTPLKDASAPKGAASPITVTLATPNCPLFIGCTIRGVKNGPSPAWLQERLTAIGLRPISALVDITNYFSFTYGRPLHVFDAAKLSGNLVVRDAKNGETLKGLNGKDYTLAEGMTVIADSTRVLALGGILGGEESGCTETTTDVFLEVALFDAVNIATTGRKLEIISDARYRFERSVDAGFAATAANLAVQMILELCGGEASSLTHAGAVPENKRTITFNPERIKALGGVDVPEAEAKRILTALGFELSGWNVTTPTWRMDVEGEADVVEEVLRIHGFDKLPNTPLPKPALTSKPAVNALQKRVGLAKRALASRSMLEVVSWSFLPEPHAKLFGWSNPALKLQNPISAELDTMRPSLLPNLLTAALANANRSIADAALFEVGVQFSGVEPNQQQIVATGIRGGNVTDTAYDAQPLKSITRAFDAFDAKADALAVLEQLGVNTASLSITTTAPAWYHPGRSGALTLGGKIILGYFGEVHPAIAKAWDMNGARISAFELFLEAIPLAKAKGKAKPMLKLSAFQPVERDFAFVVDANVSAASITKALEGVNKELITQVRIFDVYAGKGVEDGKKSIAVKLVLQAPDRTLSDADLTAIHDGVLKAASGFGGILRQ